MRYEKTEGQLWKKVLNFIEFQIYSPYSLLQVISAPLIVGLRIGLKCVQDTKDLVNFSNSYKIIVL